MINLNTRESSLLIVEVLEVKTFGYVVHPTAPKNISEYEVLSLDELRKEIDYLKYLEVNLLNWKILPTEEADSFLREGEKYEMHLVSGTTYSDKQSKCMTGFLIRRDIRIS